MNFTLPVRVTRTKKCREGFYILINGARIHARNRAAAIANVVGWLQLQRVQVVSVREYAQRTARKIQNRMPVARTRRPNEGGKRS